MDMTKTSNEVDARIAPRKMRAQLRDIISATDCTLEHAKEIELNINVYDLLDWSECEMSELCRVARLVNKAITKKGMTQ